MVLAYQGFFSDYPPAVLDPTRPARLLLLALYIGMLAQISCGVLLIYLWYKYDLRNGWMPGLGLLVSYPLVWAHLVTLPLLAGAAIY